MPADEVVPGRIAQQLRELRRIDDVGEHECSVARSGRQGPRIVAAGPSSDASDSSARRRSSVAPSRSKAASRGLQLQRAPAPSHPRPHTPRQDRPGACRFVGRLELRPQVDACRSSASPPARSPSASSHRPEADRGGGRGRPGSNRCRERLQLVRRGRATRHVTRCEGDLHLRREQRQSVDLAARGRRRRTVSAAVRRGPVGSSRWRRSTLPCASRTQRERRFRVTVEAVRPDQGSSAAGQIATPQPDHTDLVQRESDGDRNEADQFVGRPAGLGLGPQPVAASGAWTRRDRGGTSRESH